MELQWRASSRAKNWPQNDILKQMDIHGGTLSYEGISVLNDVEAAAFTGIKNPTPACLQWVAYLLEKEGETLYSFSMLNTNFSEGIDSVLKEQLIY